MEQDNEEIQQIIRVETNYLQLVRFSQEIHQKLNEKNQLVDKSYKKYLLEAQELILKWQLSSEKSRYIFDSDHCDDEAIERIEALREKFLHNMQAVKVRLHHLDPVKQFIEKATHLEKKLLHYRKRLELAEGKEDVEPSIEAIKKEIDQTVQAIETLLQEAPQSTSTDEIKAHLSSLIN